MSRTMRKKTNDPLGKKVLKALGVVVPFSPKTPAMELVSKVVARPDTRLYSSGQVRGKINPSRFRNRPCFCNSGLKFKDCHLNGGLMGIL